MNPPTRPEGKLYVDALKLSINKNLADIRTLLEWAERATDVGEKVRHVSQALELLDEVKTNLQDLSGR